MSEIVQSFSMVSEYNAMMEQMIEWVARYLQVDSESIRVLNQRKHLLNAERVLEVVSEYYGLSSEDILSTKRSSKISLSRAVVAYLCDEYCNMSRCEIGKAIGGRDHTTVVYSIQRIRDMIEKDEEVRTELDSIVSLLGGGI